MLKRRITVLAVIIVILSAFALGVRFSLSYREVIGQNCEDELLKTDFMFFGVFREDNIPDTDKIKQSLEKSNCILEVIPTGKMWLSDTCIVQEVLVKNCIKGEDISQERINVISYNGFWYKKETDVLYNWGRTNIMAEDASYIVVLDRVDNGYGTYYYNNFPIGAVNCDDRKCTEYIDVAKSYNYEELKTNEFFADSQAALDKLYEIKKMVLRYIK